MIRKLLPKLYGAYFNLLALLSPSKAARSAFKTFCKVRKGRVMPAQEAYLREAMAGREKVAGHELQKYRWPGGGDAVLLIHGWESNSFRWRNLVAVLQDAGYDIYAFDAPGHGYSSGNHLHVPLFAECVNHMISQIKPAYLIGHSMGGMTSLYTLYRYPDAGVQKIVTIGAPSEFGGFLNHFRELLGLSDSMMVVLDKYVLDTFGLRVAEFTATRFAAGLSQKGLLFHDIHDKIAPFHASERVHENWPGSRLVATEGLGHSMHQEEVNKKIVDFLKSPDLSIFRRDE